MPRSTVPLFRSGLRAGHVLACLAGLLVAGVSIGCGGDIESRMAEVRALQDVGQFQASIEELREVLTVTPDLAEANYRLGLALVQTGEPSRAVWPLQKAAESSEYEIAAGVLLASTYQQTQNYDEAVRAATRVLEIDPERQAAMRIRANANLSSRRLEESLEDTSRLVELYPDDYGVRALHATVLADLGRLEEAELEHDKLKEMGAASDDPAFRNRACIAPAVFAKDVLRDNDRALGLYEDCAAGNPSDPVVLNHIVGFFDSIDQPERGTALVRSSADAAPEDLGLRQILANRLLRTGDPEGAEQVLRDAVDQFGSAQAWQILVMFYRVQQNPEKALEASEKVAELTGGGNDRVRFTQADILVDLGQIDRAEEIAGALEQPMYAQLIRGRILLARGDPEGALRAFERGISAWPNNAGARFLAGIAARDMGDYDRALSELREAVRAGNRETNAALEIARIYLLQGRNAQSVTFANMALRGPGGVDQREAYVIAIRALAAQQQFDRARATVEVLSTRGHGLAALTELARLEGQASGPAASLAVIDGSGLDLAAAENRELLRLAADDLYALDRGDEAIARIEAAAQRDAESAELQTMLGHAYVRAGDEDRGRAAYQGARELDAKNADALSGLAWLEASQGDLTAAIALLDEAYALDDTRGDYAYSAAQLSRQAGDQAGSEARLREIVKHHPDVVGARNDLAWALAERGEDLDLALTLAQEAVRLSPTPPVLDTLGFVHLKRGDSAKAVEVLEQALAAGAGSPSLHYRLATALRESGNDTRAREELELALAVGAFPEADAARRELAQLQQN